MTATHFITLKRDHDHSTVVFAILDGVHHVTVVQPEPVLTRYQTCRPLLAKELAPTEVSLAEAFP